MIQNHCAFLLLLYSTKNYLYFLLQCIFNIFQELSLFWSCYYGFKWFILYAGGKKKPLKAPKKQSKDLDDVSSVVQRFQLKCLYINTEIMVCELDRSAAFRVK